MSERLKIGFYTLCDTQLDKKIFLEKDKECVEILQNSGIEVIHIKNKIISDFAPCLSMSYLNDENIVVSCEADMNAALTMFILSKLSGQPISFNDISYIDKEKNILRLLNCGMLPISFARSKKDIKIRNMLEGMGSYDEKNDTFRTKGGACTNFICKPGQVTLARFARISGEYVCQMSIGKTFEPEGFLDNKEIWGTDCLPWAFVRFDGDIENFIQNIRSNHLHMVYGDYLNDLKEVCGLLGVRPIICN
jgi:L-fucose/D-arabinose isomerase